MNPLAVLIWSLIAIALIIYAPFLIIWSINTLFGLSIVYTFKTWIAVVILFGGGMG